MRKYEDYLKLENAEAHLQVVLGNLTEANNGVSSALLAKAAAEQAEAYTNERINKASGELMRIKASAAEVSASTENRLAAVAKREGELSLAEQASSRQLLEYSAAVARIKRDIAAEETYRRNIMADNDALDANKKQKLEDLEDIAILIHNAKKEYADIQTLKTKSYSDMQDERLAHELDTAVAIKRRDDALQAALEAEQKAAKASEPIDDREAVVKSKEMNMLIYQQRWIELFAHYFPGVTPPKI